MRPRVHELRYRSCTLQAGSKLTILNRRKFFSSHEKLILEKRAVADQTSELASGSTSRAGSAIPFRHFHSRRRACTIDTHPQEPQFTQEEAAFFLSLPEKVRKQLYSREEQVVILAKAEQALDEAAAIEQRLHEFSFPWSDNSNSETTSKADRRRSSFSTFNPVSYTHLTLPTIYSV